MKALLAVDQSDYSDRALVKLLERYPAQDPTIRLCMIINPFMPPPVTSFIESPGYFQFAMRYQAQKRLEQLAQILKLRDLEVEVELVETRIPQSAAIPIRAFRWKADILIVGIHSLFGIKKWLLQIAFGLVTDGMNSPRLNNPGNQPGSRTKLMDRRAA